MNKLMKKLQALFRKTALPAIALLVLVSSFGATQASANACSDIYHNLSGTVVSTGSPATARITNNSDCTYTISLASYKQFSIGTDWITSQTFVDSVTRVIGPHETIDTNVLRVSVPSCHYQIDLIEGSAITPPDYGGPNHALFDAKFGGGELCGYVPPPTPASNPPAPTPTPQPIIPPVTPVVISAPIPAPVPSPIVINNTNTNTNTNNNEGSYPYYQHQQPTYTYQPPVYQAPVYVPPTPTYIPVAQPTIIRVPVTTTVSAPAVRTTPTSLVLINSSVDRTQPIVPTIDNTRPHPGDEINYTVNYQNIGTGSITNLRLQMNLPQEVDYLSSIPGNPNISNGHSLLFNLGTLKANGSGTASVRVRVRDNIPEGSDLNFPATLSYNDPSGTPKSVFANVSAQVWKQPADENVNNTNNTINLGANVFGAGFMPNNLFEWLLIIIFALLVLWAFKYILSRMYTEKIVYVNTTDSHH